jgi:predicted DNA binding CopG/RHH family protein
MKFPPARDLDGLADDIATLSYEHALKTHARYRPVADDTQSQPQQPAFPGFAAPVALGHAPENVTREEAPPPAHLYSSPAEPENRKSASVTVRLTRSEDDRLRQRAAEAGMTISAYLRSCAFEVETLRAQVKQTIADLRHAEPPPEPRKSQFSLFPWRKRTAPSAA